MSIFTREPVLTMVLVQAVLLAVTAFGLDLSGEQVAAIQAVVAGVLGVVVRQSVTPVGKPGE
jgi:uncharacterized protein (DUF697 family)